MEKMVPVKAKCPKCGRIDEFEISAAGLEKRSKGAKLAEAFPDLPEERLQQLAFHVCPECQMKEEQG